MSFRKYIQLILGIVLIIIGIAVMLVPFIPVGYALILTGVFFLASYVPALRRLLNYLKKKDKRGILIRIEKKIQRVSDKLSGKRRKHRNPTTKVKS